VWWEHLGAAAAVFFAVAGKVFEHQVWFEWAELGILVLVAVLVLFARLTHLQDRWTACRLGAEQLRIARMALPLFVLPPALVTSDKPEPGFGDEETKFQFLALTQMKRAIREQGLPQVETNPRAPCYLTARLARTWVQVIVSNQVVYHHRNHRLLHHAERHLHLFTQIAFGLAIAAVVTHFWVESDLLLLVTAAGPAFAAALHGVGTRLGLVHRVALSREMERSLQGTGRALRALGRNPRSDDPTWREIRRLTLKAASDMGQENISWHGLVRRYRDDLP